MPGDHCRANAKTLWEWLDCKLRENYIGKEKDMRGPHIIWV
jgi:hypothetical protein